MRFGELVRQIVVWKDERTMRDFVEIVVHGKVIGKGRPHFVRKTGVAITPARTRSYESIVRDYAMAEMNGDEPWEGRIEARILAVHEIPKSWTKKKKELAEQNLIAPAKPDVDNVVKIVLDACNRTVYVDDQQVTKCTVTKQFGNKPYLFVRFVKL